MSIGLNCFILGTSNFAHWPISSHVALATFDVHGHRKHTGSGNCSLL